MNMIKRFIFLVIGIIILLTGCTDNKSQYDNPERNAEKCIVNSDAVIYEEEKYDSVSDSSMQEQSQILSYVANKKSGKLHYPDCASVRQMNEENKLHLRCTRDEALSKGYEPCMRCEP